MRYLLFIWLISYSISVDSQSHKLISSQHLDDNKKNCKVIGDCISDKFIINDTFNLIIYHNNDCLDLSKLRDTFIYSNDTILIYFKDTSRMRFSIQYDSINKRIDTFYYVHLLVHNSCIGGYDFKKNIYKFYGFKTIPKVIKFRHNLICDCPNKPIKFDIFDNDTINLINSDGQEDGLWLRFFKSGKIEERKIYKNGKFLSGTTYDEAGNDLHYISDGYNTIINMKE